MQEALKNLEAAKDAASPEIIAGINNMIASDQELHDIMLAHAADDKELLPTMQANFDAAQAEYDKASNRVSELYAEFDKAMRNMASDETIRQLREAIIEAETQKEICESTLDHRRDRLESQKYWIGIYENRAEGYKASANERIAKRDALLDNLKKAQTAYDDACKAYEEAKAAADKAASPEITQPTETTPPSNSAQPAETAQPASSPATGKNTPPSSTKQANSSSGKQADTTAGKLANTGDAAPSAIALAAVAAAGLGITATATRRIKNSK